MLQDATISLGSKRQLNPSVSKIAVDMMEVCPSICLTRKDIHSPFSLFFPLACQACRSSISQNESRLDIFPAIELKALSLMLLQLSLSSKKYMSHLHIYIELAAGGFFAVGCWTRLLVGRWRGVHPPYVSICLLPTHL